MLSAAYELLCLALLSLLLFAIWPPLSLLPWALAAGWAAWCAGGWGRPERSDRQ